MSTGLHVVVLDGHAADVDDDSLGGEQRGMGGGGGLGRGRSLGSGGRQEVAGQVGGSRWPRESVWLEIVWQTMEWRVWSIAGPYLLEAWHQPGPKGHPGSSVVVTNAAPSTYGRQEKC